MTDWEAVLDGARVLPVLHMAKAAGTAELGATRTGVVEATRRPRLELFDRVVGGESFASGLIYGLLAGECLEACVEYGAAHGALAMTTPKDTSMASAAEVVALAGGRNARVKR